MRKIVVVALFLKWIISTILQMGELRCEKIVNLKKSDGWEKKIISHELTAK